MPYGISENQEDCQGWATVKKNNDGTYETIGCHQSKEDAIDQMIAVSIAEDLEALGEVRELELRAVDLSPPEFMRENARKGLKYHEEGLSGDGLKPQTVEDARKMANGDVSEAKWRKIAPWIARHLVDLEAEGVAEGEITAGVVAHYLWGSGATKDAAERAMKYAQRVIDQLNEEERMEQLTKDVATNNWVVAEDGTENRRIAFSNMEVRASDDGTKLVGYAAVFDSPSEPLPWTEFVKRGAFNKTINDGADVRLLIDHEGVPLARTTSGTLVLREDDRGLLVESDLDPSNPDAARLISALRRGDISQMSFAFRTIKDSWNTDRSVRELREVQLFDVSVVTFPAYESTVAELRARQEVATIPATNTLALRRRQIQIARNKMQ